MPSVNEILEELSKDQLNWKARHASEQSQILDRLGRIEAARDNLGRCAGDNEERKAFDKFLRTGSGLERKDIGSNTASGALVPTVDADEIVSKALAQSRIGSLVRLTKTDSADYRRILRAGPTGAAWVGESGSRDATADANFRQIVMTHGELYAYVAFTNWVLNDSRINLAAELLADVQAQFAKGLGTAIITGNGTNTLTGMLNTSPTNVDDGASPARAASVYEYVPSGESASLNHHPLASPPAYGDDRLLDLFFTLKPEYRANATWIMASPTLAALRKFKDSTGSPIWQPSMGAGVDQGDGFLLGRPVCVCESVPAIGANAFAVGVGDLKQAYELIQIGPLEITRDDVTTPGKTKYYVRSRWGGAVLDNDSLKWLKLAAT
jgi:HK97 family phage major capsid protein